MFKFVLISSCKKMSFFDFHNHKINSFGIYNLEPYDSLPKSLFSVGIHPKDIDRNVEANFEKIRKIANFENCIAIGECGLDGLIPVDEKLQEQVFDWHIKLANEIQKPIIIHCVRKFSEIQKFKKKSEVPMIIHGFNKKEIIAKQLLENGFQLSFGKAVLQNVSLQQIIKKISLDHMFLETDNDDFEIGLLYKKVAELKEISIEDLQKTILENLEKITRL